MGKWRRKLLECQHDENFFPGVLNQFRGTYPYTKIKRAWFSELLVLWIIILSIASGLVHKTVNDSETTKMKEALGSMCDKQAWMLQNQFTINVNRIVLAMMARFYYQDNAIYTSQMLGALDSYVDNGTRDCPLHSGVAYAECVGLCERENYQRGCLWQINMTFRSQPGTAEEVDAYACVLANALENSLHMMRGKEDRDLVLKARPVEKAVLSGPFRLLEPNRIGVLLTFRVSRSKLSPSMGLEERIRAIAGYIGVVFEFESLVENLLWQLGNQTVLITIYDITNSTRSLMYGHNYVKSDRPMMHESKLELGDPYRKHLMICRYRDVAFLSWIPAIVAVSILTIGLIVPCVLYAAAIRNMKFRQASLRIQGLEIQLQDANTANSQLRADASEIKQPAYIIIQTLAMLLETELSSAQRGYTRIAQACGRRQIALVDKALESPNLPVITHTI